MSRFSRNAFCFEAIVLVAMLLSLQVMAHGSEPTAKAAGGSGSLRVGWAEKEITPPRPVILTGQGHARVSEGVKDPLISTALAIESLHGEKPVQVVMVTCDLLSISDGIRDSVRELVKRDVPELDPQAIFIGATHTHTAPYHYVRARYRQGASIEEEPYGLPLPVMSGSEYVRFASERIAEAVIEAWNARQPSGVAYGLGHAVVGRNRVIAYRDGSSKMYGSTRTATFSHVEGYEDHSVNLMATYRANGELSGLIVNIAAPSQIEGSAWQVSADFWHETREELRRRFGKDLFVLPQCSAAGDQNSLAPVERPAEDRMSQLAGRTRRQEIAVRIADAVSRTLPLIEEEIAWDPVCGHRIEIVELPRRPVSEEQVQAALAKSAVLAKRYQKLLDELEQTPEKREKARWYQEITRAFRSTLSGKRMESKFREQQENLNLPVELHAVRMGDVGFVTNPFELYLDHAMRIKGRSPAMQTFVVQLVGPGSYAPTARSIEGEAYGSKPSNNEIGAEGGTALVEWSLDAIGKLWKQ